MEFNFTKREKTLIIINFVLLLSLTVVLTLDFLKDDSDEIKIITKTEKTVSSMETQGESYVSVSGMVKNPGVVAFAENERVKDAIERAGGFSEDADQTALNLAEFLEDGSEIYVPSKEETKEVKKYSSSSKTTAGSKYVASKTNKMNINTAEKYQLMALPGIGEALAERIIEYRSTTRFNTIEDIKNVSGIGDARFNNIKDYIEAY